MGGAIILTPVLIIFGGHAPMGHWLLLALLTASSTLLGNLLLFAALRRGPVALVAPIVALYGPLAAVVSIATGQHVRILTMGGLALAMAGLILVVIHRHTATTEKHHRPLQAGLLAFAASLALGAGLVGATKVGHHIGAFWMLATVEFLGSLVFGGTLLALRRLSFSPITIAYNSLGSVTTSVGYITYITVSTRYGIAVPAVLAAQQSVVAAGFGILLLKEKPARAQALGVGLVALGVALAAV